MATSSRLVRRIGLSLAALGLVAGAIAYVNASAGADADAGPVAQAPEMRELARLGGTAGVQAIKFDRWMGSLWHGRRLAFTLALLGLAVGAACWHVGGLMDEEALED